MRAPGPAGGGPRRLRRRHPAVASLRAGSRQRGAGGPRGPGRPGGSCHAGAAPARRAVGRAARKQPRFRGDGPDGFTPPAPRSNLPSFIQPSRAS
ncbi:hypothetical protein NR800_01295 [Corallococcus interemptor]